MKLYFSVSGQRQGGKTLTSCILTEMLNKLFPGKVYINSKDLEFRKLNHRELITSYLDNRQNINRDFDNKTSVNCRMSVDDQFFSANEYTLDLLENHHYQFEIPFADFCNELRLHLSSMCFELNNVTKTEELVEIISTNVTDYLSNLYFIRKLEKNKFFQNVLQIIVVDSNDIEIYC